MALRGFTQLRPKPLAPRSGTVTHFDASDIDLNKLCTPAIQGEMILDFLCARPAPVSYPAAFTEKSATSKLILGKRKAGGRPPSEKTVKRRKTAALSGPPTPRPTRLRVDKPVSAQLNIDIWNHIFSWTDPSTLFKIQTATPFFKHALSYDRLWRSSRENTYGHDMPSAPAGLKEQSYVELVCNTGCHVCGSPNVRKVYWAFLRRWCNECYRKLTVREREAKQILEHSATLLECIMPATRDSWGHYIGAGVVRQINGVGDGRVSCYLRTDVEKLKSDYEAMIAGETPEMTTEEKTERRQTWVDERTKKIQDLLTHLREIEAWQKRGDSRKVEEYSGARAEREQFFKNRARALMPPMHEAYLANSKAYQRAIKIPKAPSERCWELLLPKLKDGL